MPIKTSRRIKRVLRTDPPHEIGTRLFYSDPNKGKYWGTLSYHAVGDLHRVHFDDDETPDEYFTDAELCKAVAAAKRIIPSRT